VVIKLWSQLIFRYFFVCTLLDNTRQQASAGNEQIVGGSFVSEKVVFNQPRTPPQNHQDPTITQGWADPTNSYIGSSTGHAQKEAQRTGRSSLFSIQLAQALPELTIDVPRSIGDFVGAHMFSRVPPAGLLSSRVNGLSRFARRGGGGGADQRRRASGPSCIDRIRSLSEGKRNAVSLFFSAPRPLHHHDGP